MKIKSYYNLPKNIIFCKKCVLSNQKPNSIPEFQHTRSTAGREWARRAGRARGGRRGRLMPGPGRAGPVGALGLGVRPGGRPRALVLDAVGGAERHRARHVREVAKLYGVPVILHTDHCMRSWLPWFDGLLEANEDYYKAHGEPLFSSHMLAESEKTQILYY